MDSLMWALAVAELTADHDEVSEHFKDMRFELSKILGKLVEGLPDPELNENALEPGALAQLASDSCGLLFEGRRLAGADTIQIHPSGLPVQNTFTIQTSVTW